ncbi:MAG: hypothetical protein M1826_002869 [Phylliscum demangeonii]|nr:MAG: hypothetical protein M1826_002869 [Phylliscum demangeonii]
MSAASVPSIPPRPSRTSKPVAGGHDLPRIPPRPTRRMDRSASPHRDSFAPSPLNDSTFVRNPGRLNSALHDQGTDAAGLHPPQRPPSVSLPSIGQEGNEYAGFFEAPESTPATSDSDAAATSPTTRKVGDELEIHAPTPALSISSAKARIATVTRTDSYQAAAVGIGKARDDDKDPHVRQLKSQRSFAASASFSAGDRATSTQPSESDHGIPEIGIRVPMYPDAGDVQAPSPALHSHTPHGVGIGTPHENAHRTSRPQGRSRGGREHSRGPPGSYGLHGHGTPIYDKFEKAWYEKHPEALEREEHGEYGPGIGGGRGAWALSREDLDRIVRDTASRGAGVGSSPAVWGTPDEQIGYMASEEYAAKLASDSRLHHQEHADESEGRPDSPSKAATSSLAYDPSEVSGSEKGEAKSEDEGNVIHIPPPLHRFDKIGGGGYDPPTEDLGPRGGNTAEEGGWVDELGDGVPILASDEVAKEPGAEFLHPALSPPLERSAAEFPPTWDVEHQPPRGIVSHGSSTPGSRASSRPASTSGLGAALSRYLSLDERNEMGTPLEDVEEYEPLFPDEEDDGDVSGSTGKRPGEIPSGLPMPPKFPSEDIWEDAPSSAQLQATISSPALLEDDARTVVPDRDEDRSSVMGVDARGKAEGGPQRVPSFGRATAEPKVLGSTVDIHRSGTKQRFPSRDIWEDTPASHHLETVVSAPQVDEMPSPTELPEPSALGSSATHEREDGSGRASVRGIGDGSLGASAVPAVPPRPARIGRHPEPSGSGGVSLPPSRSRSDNQAPVLPERSKPPVPARPARSVHKDGGEGIPLSQTTSNTSTKSAGSGPEEMTVPPAPRPKPAVPARPAGGKIASLKAGFLSDLNQRLQLGPRPPAPIPAPAPAADSAPGDETERAPLVDARKGRARGPARRKPTVSPEKADPAADPTAAAAAAAHFDISPALTVWQISGSGVLDVAVPPSLTKLKPDETHPAAVDADPAATSSVLPNKPGMNGDDVASGRKEEPRHSAPDHASDGPTTPSFRATTAPAAAALDEDAGDSLPRRAVPVDEMLTSDAVEGAGPAAAGGAEMEPSAAVVEPAAAATPPPTTTTTDPE